MKLSNLYELKSPEHRSEYMELYLGLLSIWRYIDTFNYTQHQLSWANKFMIHNAPGEFIFEKKRFCHRQVGLYFGNSKAIKENNATGFFANFGVSSAHSEFFKSKMDDKQWLVRLVSALITSTNRYRFEDFLARTGEKQAEIDKYVQKTLGFLLPYRIEAKINGNIFTIIFCFERNAVASYDAPEFLPMVF